MVKSWRLSSFSGALLAGYFIPIWTLDAFRVMVSPVHGLFERPNIAFALFASDYLQVSSVGMVRTAWLLALGRMTVVAFFAIFLALATLSRVRKSGGCDEALSIALGIGTVISFAGMLIASSAGEIEALRVYATELMLLLGTAIVLLIERPAAALVKPAPVVAEHDLNQTMTPAA